MSLLGKETSLWILLPLSILAVIMEVARVRSKHVARFIYSIFGSIMRPEEKSAMGSRITINGASWVIISAALLALIFPIYIASASLAMFMLGDAAAAIWGRKFGRTPWPKSKKTLEGSFAFLVIAAVTLSLFNILAWYFVLLVAFVAMLLEVLPIPVNDNVRVPIIAGFMIFFLEKGLKNPDLTLFF